MACRSCRTSLELLSRRPGLIRPSTTYNVSSVRIPVAATRSRAFHRTQPRRDVQNEGPPEGPAGRGIKDVLANAMGRKTLYSYAISAASEKIYNVCAAQADYKISPQDRDKDAVRKGEDGEEIGVGGGMWHDDLDLLPTFSTWSQVTMLHLYLLMVRLRCMEQDEYKNWQGQLTDHFFLGAEEKMHLNHNIVSSGQRQRYLKDLFITWRGITLAYDEGLVKGDAVLAGAVWRNIYKGRDDVDIRKLAAIVSWMRLTLRTLDQMDDEALLIHAHSVFKWPVTSELMLVDQPAPELKSLFDQARKTAPPPPSSSPPPPPPPAAEAKPKP